jgi:hypothetical protein
MFKEHYVFKSPYNENAAIWRYMDFPKFVDLLDDSALFFCRADKLGDPFEGSYTKPLANKLPGKDDEFFQFINDKEAALQMKMQSLKRESQVRQWFSTFTFVNCWHLSENESAAMWRLYLKSGEGVAIKSTFNKLKDCFFFERHEINIGMVEYVDYDNYEWPLDNYFYPFLHKRKSFEHEKELRAIIAEFPRVKEIEIKPGVKMRTSNLSRPPFRNGIKAKVDLDMLINEIYLAPTSPKWQYRLIKSLLRKYKLDKEVYRSKLDDRAIF